MCFVDRTVKLVDKKDFVAMLSSIIEEVKTHCKVALTDHNWGGGGGLLWGKDLIKIRRGRAFDQIEILKREVYKYFKFILYTFSILIFK